MTDREFLNEVLPQFPEGVVYELTSNGRYVIVWWKFDHMTIDATIKLENQIEVQVSFRRTIRGLEEACWFKHTSLDQPILRRMLRTALESGVKAEIRRVEFAIAAKAAHTKIEWLK